MPHILTLRMQQGQGIVPTLECTEPADASKSRCRQPYPTTSIQEVGMRMPILLGSDGRVWDGHHRFAAAEHLGIPVVPVIFEAEVAQASTRPPVSMSQREGSES